MLLRALEGGGSRHVHVEQQVFGGRRPLRAAPVCGEVKSLIQLEALREACTDFRQPFAQCGAHTLRTNVTRRMDYQGSGWFAVERGLALTPAHTELDPSNI